MLSLRKVLSFLYLLVIGLLILSLALLPVCSQFLEDQAVPRITNFAGTGSATVSGENGPATSAGIPIPVGMTMDTQGNLYISTRSAIRVVNTRGIIRVFAGSNSQTGSSGDGGLASSSRLTSPSALFLNTVGDLYISDTGAHRVRKINTTSRIISTYAGSGSATYSGENVPAITGNLCSPQGLWGDTMGFMYVISTCNNRLRVINPNATISSLVTYTTAGASSATLTQIYGLWGDSNGNLYLADRNSNTLRIIAAGTRVITRFMGTGIVTTGSYNGDNIPASSASLNAPNHVYVDRFGHIFVVDTNNNRIRKIHGQTSKIYTIVGTGVAGNTGDGGLATSATIRAPRFLWVDTLDRLYVADSSNNRVRRIEYMFPSSMPTSQPSQQPTSAPSEPTSTPTRTPSSQPSRSPTSQPSTSPTNQPSITPTSQPTAAPSQPTAQPSRQPSSQPSRQPSRQPSSQPSRQPTSQPSRRPTQQPTVQPSRQPTSQPSRRPTNQPTCQPSRQPTGSPTFSPTSQPSNQPTSLPSVQPSTNPSTQPSTQPTSKPSRQPSNQPTARPTRQPTAQPTRQPTSQPSRQPSSRPSAQPSRQPTRQPSSQPTRQPTRQPFSFPTAQPSRQPSAQPSRQPTNQPSVQPTGQPSLAMMSNYVNITSIEMLQLGKTSVNLLVNLFLKRNVLLYCGVYLSNPDWKPSNPNDILDIVRQNRMVVSNSVKTYITLKDLDPITSYDIYCLTTSFDGVMMPAPIAAKNVIKFVTACCKEARVIVSQNIVFEKSSFEKGINIELKQAPSSSLSIRLQATALSGESTMSISPNTITFPANAINLVSPFVGIYSNLKGRFALGVTFSGAAANEYEVSFINSNFIDVVTIANISLTPVPQSAIFSYDGIQILVQFSIPTNRGGYATEIPCSKVFNMTGIPSLAASCMWTSDRVIALQYDLTKIPSPKYSNITIGTPLKIIARSGITAKCVAILNRCRQFQQVQARTLFIQAPANAVKPIVSISSPTTISGFSNIVLDLSASSGSGGRRWASSSFAVLDNRSQRIVELEAFLNSRQYSLFPPTPILSSMLLKDRTYTFIITLCNFLQKCGTSSHSVIILPMNSSSCKIEMNVRGASVRTITARSSLILQSDVAILPCTFQPLNPANFSYNWTVFSSTTGARLSSIRSISSNPSQFSVLPYTFTAGRDYDIVVTVFPSRQRLSGTFLSRYAVHIAVIPDDLIANIQVDSYELNPTETKKIDAGLSRDLNIRDNFGLAAGLEFTWNCIQVLPTLNTSICPFRVTSRNYPSSKRLEFLTITSGASNSTGRFTLVVSKDSRTSQTFVDIKALAKDIIKNTGIVSLATSATDKINVVNRLELFGSVSVAKACWTTWSVNDASLNLTSMAGGRVSEYLSISKRSIINNELLRQSFSFQLAENVLPPNRVLTFTLRCGNDINKLTVSTNGSPQPGKFLISPPAGREFVTSFYVEALSWVDNDLPLHFQFSMYSESLDDYQIIYPKSDLSWFYHYFTVGLIDNDWKLPCKVEVYDVFEAVNSAITSIQVKPSGKVILFNETLANVVISPALLNDGKSDIRLTSYLLNKAICDTLDFNCSDIRRYECSQTAHTCGSCYSGYIGEPGDANTVCLTSSEILTLYNTKMSTSSLNDLVFTNDLTMGSRMMLTNTDIYNQRCKVDFDCMPNTDMSWFYCDTSIKRCREQRKICSETCLEHGQCQYQDTNAHRILSTCLISDPNCTAICNCHEGYYGQHCDLTSREMLERMKVRSDALEATLGFARIDELTPTSVEQYGQLIFSIVATKPEEVNYEDALHVVSYYEDLLRRIANDTSFSGSEVMGVLRSIDELSTMMHLPALTSKMFNGSLDYTIHLRNNTFLRSRGVLYSMLDLVKFIKTRFLPGEDDLTMLFSQSKMLIASRYLQGQKEMIRLGLPKSSVDQVYSNPFPRLTLIGTQQNLSDNMELVFHWIEMKANSYRNQQMLRSNVHHVAFESKRNFGSNQRNLQQVIDTFEFQIPHYSRIVEFAVDYVVKNFTTICTSRDDRHVETYFCVDSGTLLRHTCAGVKGSYISHCPKAIPVCSSVTVTATRSTTRIPQASSYQLEDIKPHPVCEVTSFSEYSSVCKCSFASNRSIPIVFDDQYYYFDQMTKGGIAPVTSTSTTSYFLDSQGAAELVVSVDYIPYRYADVFIKEIEPFADPSPLALISTFLPFAIVLFLLSLQYRKHRAYVQSRTKQKKKVNKIKPDGENDEEAAGLDKLTSVMPATKHIDTHEVDKVASPLLSPEDFFKEYIHFFDSLLPPIFTAQSLMTRLWEDFSKHYRYFDVIGTLLAVLSFSSRRQRNAASQGDISQGLVYMRRYLRLLTMMSCMLFVLTMVIMVSQSGRNNGSCEKNKTEFHCLQARAIFDEDSTICLWRKVEPQVQIIRPTTLNPIVIQYECIYAQVDVTPYALMIACVLGILCSSMVGAIVEYTLQWFDSRLIPRIRKLNVAEKRIQPQASASSEQPAEFSFRDGFDGNSKRAKKPASGWLSGWMKSSRPSSRGKVEPAVSNAAKQKVAMINDGFMKANQYRIIPKPIEDIRNRHKTFLQHHLRYDSTTTWHHLLMHHRQVDKRPPRLLSSKTNSFSTFLSAFQSNQSNPETTREGEFQDFFADLVHLRALLQQAYQQIMQSNVYEDYSETSSNNSPLNAALSQKHQQALRSVQSFSKEIISELEDFLKRFDQAWGVVRVPTRETNLPGALMNMPLPSQVTDEYCLHEDYHTYLLQEMRSIHQQAEATLDHLQLTANPQVQSAIEILHQSMRDLMGRQTSASYFYTRKFEESFRLAFPIQRFWLQLVAVSIFFFNLGCIGYSITRIIGQDLEWKTQLMMSFLILIFLEVVIFSVGEWYWMQIFIPSLAYYQVRHAFIQLRSQLVMSLEVLMKEKIFMYQDLRQLQTRYPSSLTLSQAMPLNSSQYFCRAHALAKCIPDVLESMLLNIAHDVLPPSQLVKTWKQRVAFSSLDVAVTSTSCWKRFRGKSAPKPDKPTYNNHRIVPRLVIPNMPLEKITEEEHDEEQPPVSYASNVTPFQTTQPSNTGTHAVPTKENDADDNDLRAVARRHHRASIKPFPTKNRRASRIVFQRLTHSLQGKTFNPLDYVDNEIEEEGLFQAEIIAFIDMSTWTYQVISWWVNTSLNYLTIAMYFTFLHTIPVIPYSLLKACVGLLWANSFSMFAMLIYFAIQDNTLYSKYTMLLTIVVILLGLTITLGFYCMRFINLQMLQLPMSPLISHSFRDATGKSADQINGGGNPQFWNSSPRVYSMKMQPLTLTAEEEIHYQQIMTTEPDEAQHHLPKASAFSKADLKDLLHMLGQITPPERTTDFRPISIAPVITTKKEAPPSPASVPVSISVSKPLAPFTPQSNGNKKYRKASNRNSTMKMWQEKAPEEPPIVLEKTTVLKSTYNNDRENAKIAMQSLLDDESEEEEEEEEDEEEVEERKSNGTSSGLNNSIFGVSEVDETKERDINSEEEEDNDEEDDDDDDAADDGVDLNIINGILSRMAIATPTEGESRAKEFDFMSSSLNEPRDPLVGNRKFLAGASPTPNMLSPTTNKFTNPDSSWRRMTNIQNDVVKQKVSIAQITSNLRISRPALFQQSTLKGKNDDSDDDEDDDDDEDEDEEEVINQGATTQVDATDTQTRWSSVRKANLLPQQTLSTQSKEDTLRKLQPPVAKIVEVEKLPVVDLNASRGPGLQMEDLESGDQLVVPPSRGLMKNEVIVEEVEQPNKKVDERNSKRGAVAIPRQPKEQRSDSLNKEAKVQLFNPLKPQYTTGVNPSEIMSNPKRAQTPVINRPHSQPMKPEDFEGSSVSSEETDSFDSEEFIDSDDETTSTQRSENAKRLKKRKQSIARKEKRRMSKLKKEGESGTEKKGKEVKKEEKKKDKKKNEKEKKKKKAKKKKKHDSDDSSDDNAKADSSSDDN